MSTLASLNLIRLFDFYLAAMFVLGTWRRVEFYRGASGLVLTLPGRWPHLFQLVKQHRTVFLTWSTLRPLVLTLLLSVVHSLATRLVWPQANVDAGPVAHALAGVRGRLDWEPVAARQHGVRQPGHRHDRASHPNRLPAGDHPLHLPCRLNQP